MSINRLRSSPERQPTLTANPGSVIASLQLESDELRKRVSACRALEDQIAYYNGLIQADERTRRAIENEANIKQNT
jgi:hypothetical protein